MGGLVKFTNPLPLWLMFRKICLTLKNLLPGNTILSDDLSIKHSLTLVQNKQKHKQQNPDSPHLLKQADPQHQCC